jgi:hypothetical protein
MEVIFQVNVLNSQQILIEIIMLAKKMMGLIKKNNFLNLLCGEIIGQIFAFIATYFTILKL